MFVLNAAAHGTIKAIVGAMANLSAPYSVTVSVPHLLPEQTLKEKGRQAQETELLTNLMERVRIWRFNEPDYEDRTDTFYVRIMSEGVVYIYNRYEGEYVGRYSTIKEFVAAFPEEADGGE